MPSEHRSASEIEREIERERSDLVSSIEEIKSRFTPEAVIGEISRNMREHGGDMGHAVSRSVKQNPVGLALTGVGLAWMIFGRSHDEHPRVRTRAGQEPDDLDDRFPVDPLMPMGSADPDGLPPAHAYPAWVDEEDVMTGPRGYPSALHADRRSARDGHDGHGAGERVKAAGASVKSGAKSAGEGASDAMHRARERLSHGTEHLSDAARDRVVAARMRAVEARRRVGASARRGARRGRETATELFEEHPLVAGALALAAGAALAASMPRTRPEDEMFGEYSDQLIEEAEHIYREERDKAERVASAALDETREVVREKGEKADSAAEAAVDKARHEVADARDRVMSAAEEEADRQNLGKPRI